MKRHRIATIVAIWLFAMSFCAVVHASEASRQQDFFKSMQESVGHQQNDNVSNTPAILLAVGGALVMGMLVLLSKRQEKVAKKPAPLNSPGKLSREILREGPLKASEMKQLKMLADSLTQQLGEVPDPMTMLLCPSLLARGLKTAPARLDRRLLAQIVRKMKLSEVNQPTQPPPA
jgi:hypothetical protein